MSLRRAVCWSIFWVLCAFGVAGYLAAWKGGSAASLFFAAYTLEKALSIDNLMVFSAIFAYFGIASSQQPKILYWGFLGAIVFRFLFLYGGSAVLGLHPVVGVIFGLAVVWSGYQMLVMTGGDETPEDYEAKWFVRMARKFSTTPAVICLVAIEISDLIFAFDSMPVVLAITSDTVIVYAAVICAVLGLRSLYFVLDALLARLSRLSTGIIAVLFFVGAKMAGKSLAEWTGIHQFGILEIPPLANVLVVVGVLGLAVIASILWPAEPNAKA